MVIVSILPNRSAIDGAKKQKRMILSLLCRQSKGQAPKNESINQSINQSTSDLFAAPSPKLRPVEGGHRLHRRQPDGQASVADGIAGPVVPADAQVPAGLDKKRIGLDKQTDL